jgi:outer membrane protein assembly factor BamB
MPWYRSTAVLLLACVLAPPIGLALLWTRPGGIFRKLAGTVVIAGLTIAHLMAFWGLRTERDGTGIPRFFTFTSPEQRDVRVEESRAAMKPAAQEQAPAEPPTNTPAVSEPKPGVKTAANTAGAFWSDFRGPGRNGVYSEMPILTRWPSSGLRQLWKQPAGGGYASFVVAEGLAFTIEQRRDQEVAAAYDLKTGREQWTNAWRSHFQESMGGDGPRATPVWDAGRLYVQGAEGELRCLDARSGKVVWRKNILEDNGASNITWGMSNSPLVVDGKLITLPGGSGGKSVVAYDPATGERLWSALDDKTSYTSPMVVTLGGKRQVVVVTAKRAVGLTIEAGKLLWEYPWSTDYDINAAQPIVVASNRFFISAGYGHGAAVVELTPRGDSFDAKTVWENNRMKNKFNSSVLHEGNVYGLDEGILACVDVATGNQKWKGGRYGYGQLLLASGHLVVITETGELVLVKATPQQHEELARFPAIEGKTWNYPAISNGILLVRNTTEMAAFQIAP